MRSLLVQRQEPLPHALSIALAERKYRICTYKLGNLGLVKMDLSLFLATAKTLEDRTPILVTKNNPKVLAYSDINSIKVIKSTWRTRK